MNTTICSVEVEGEPLLESNAGACPFRIRKEAAMSDPERRELSFQNLDEVVADAEQLAAGEFRTTGNHSFPEILNHLTLSQDVSSGRVEGPPPPWYMRLMMPLMKKMIINPKPLKPGVKLPKTGEAFFWPETELDVPSAVQRLRESTEYYKQHGPLDVHPFFGKLTRQEADELNCRHAALHLSFVHPAA